MTEAGRPGAKPPGPDQSVSPPSAEPGAESLQVGQWNEHPAVVRRVFPGPRGVDLPLRVAFERRAYADIVAHAKESLQAEICGVLVGSPCRDDEGDFVHVAAVVRGAHADEGSRHVTFTQETWNNIHAAMQRNHPKLHIVGWYHSHPGFGVEFSEMDAFIQRNFFPGPQQIGLVTDPLGGDVGICMNAGEEIRYLPKFWVDSRELKCRVPDSARPVSGEARGATESSADTVAALETRISQLIQAVDDMRRTLYRWVYGLGMLTGFAILLFISQQATTLIFGEVPKPPSRFRFVPIPLNIDGKACLLGVDVVSWQIPPELLYIPPASEPQSDAAEKGAPKKGTPNNRDPNHRPDSPAATAKPVPEGGQPAPGSTRKGATP